MTSDVILAVGGNVQPLLKVDAIVSNCTGTAWLCHTAETSGNAAALGRVLKALGVKAQLVSLQTANCSDKLHPLDTFHAIERLKKLKLSDDSFNLVDESKISSFITRAYPRLKFIQLENNFKWVENDEGTLIKSGFSLNPSECLNLAPALINKGKRSNGKFRYIPTPEKAQLEALTNAGLVATFDDFEFPCLHGNDGFFVTPEGILGVFAFLNPKKPMESASQAWDECQSLSNSSILILIGEDAEICAQSVSRKVLDSSIFAIEELCDQDLVANLVMDVLDSSRQRESIRK